MKSQRQMSSGWNSVSPRDHRTLLQEGHYPSVGFGDPSLGRFRGGELAEGSFLVHAMWAEGSWGQLSRNLSFEQKELWEKDKSRL